MGTDAAGNMTSAVSPAGYENSSLLNEAMQKGRRFLAARRFGDDGVGAGMTKINFTLRPDQRPDDCARCT
jgi:hypothetical protein